MTDTTEAIAFITQPITMKLYKMAKYPALKALRNAAGFPLYRSSRSSLSVRISALLQSLEKRKTLRRDPINKFHQNQFCQIPGPLTNSVMAKGVSAAKVVATIEVPTIHQGSDLPDRKYSSVLEAALFEKYMPTPSENNIYEIIIDQSIQCNVIDSLIDIL